MRALFIVLFAAACAAPPDDTVCLKSTIEPDLSTLQWQGPGLVNGAIPPGQYVVAATYLKGKAEGFDTFQKVLVPLIDALPKTDGVLGFATMNSSACFTARTLSVWRDEAAMFKFVASPAHAAAMTKGSQISRGGSLTTHWADTEAGATLAKSAQMLGEDTGSTF